MVPDTVTHGMAEACMLQVTVVYLSMKRTPKVEDIVEHGEEKEIMAKGKDVLHLTQADTSLWIAWNTAARQAARAVAP